MKLSRAELLGRWSEENYAALCSAGRRMVAQAYSYRHYRLALAEGRLVRPANCERCGKAGKPHGHHVDYTEPLNVLWLCPLCHSRQHKADRDTGSPVLQGLPR